MSSTMNDTTKTRESRMPAATEREDPTPLRTVSAALHTASTALRIVSTAWRGANAVSALVALAHSIEGSDGLARRGPARRRGRPGGVTIFSAGVAVGAGIGVIFAPTSGADLRRAILGRAAQ
jgi:hypothetical protein